MHFKCVFTLLQWCVLVGLDWTKPMMFLSLHVTCSCIFHAYVPSFIFILILICVGAFLRVSFSLSFFWLVTLWHLNENPLRPRILFILGYLLLHFLNPLLLTYSSVKIKPVRTFQRTFNNKAFIRKAKSFYRIFPIQSRLGVTMWHLDHLSLCDHTGVLLQHARIRYFSTSFCHSCLRYAHCSYSRSYIRGTTCTESSASWLPRLWSSEECVPRRTLVSFLWDTFILGWPSKHPLLRLCKRSQIP